MTPPPGPAHEGDAGRGRAVFKWTAMDTAARCPAELPCTGCPLWGDCGGRAKRAQGFLPIEDLIAQRRRVSDEQWASEMMCRRPRRSDGVYRRFEASRHVRDDPPGGAVGEGTTLVMGMDFGLRSPTVVLWAWAWRVSGFDHVHVVAEHAAEGWTLEDHLAAMRGVARALALPEPAWVGVDPAGRQRQSHSGLSDVEVLRSAGWRVRWRPSRIAAGIEAVRRLIDHDRLTVHPRCVALIRAVQAYRFDPGRPTCDEPVKDGADHACDALRYLVVNLDASRPVGVRGY